MPESSSSPHSQRLAAGMPGLGGALDRAFAWSPQIQKFIARSRVSIRRWRWGRMAASGMEVLDREPLMAAYRDALVHLSRNGNKDVGDYYEFGVFNGVSLICMNQVIEELGLKQMRMFGFDSFAGLPDDANDDDGEFWQAGTFAAPYALAKRRLAEAGVPDKRATLIKGWFSDTLNDAAVAKHGMQRAGVIMVDADLYSSSKLSLDFSAPRVGDEAILFMGDWYTLAEREKGLVLREGGIDNMGQRRALKEFLAENPNFATEDRGHYMCFGRKAGHVFRLYRR